MKKYLGVKLISAEPMSEFGFINKIKNEEIPSNKENREGYLVTYEDGYVSWSPKDVFEKAYRPIDGLTFGLAIEALKNGKMVARKGWNGKAMFLFLSDILDFGCDIETINKLESIGVLPTVSGLHGQTIVMKTADNKLVFGWLASQTDMLAEDWEIVE
jgi:hypothetical protein